MKQKFEPRLRAGQVLELTVQELANEGVGISRDYGMPIFVNRTAPGDRVEVELFDVRKDFARAHLVKVVEPSEQRQEPPCKLFKVCGGCQWQHLSYEWQLKNKEHLVAQAVRRIAGLSVDLVKPVVPADEILHYRNKVQFPVSQCQGSKRILAGYYQQDSHTLVNIKHCPIQPEPLDRMLEVVKSVWAEHRLDAYDEKTGDGLLRHIVARYSQARGKILLTLVVNCDEQAGRLTESSARCKPPEGRRSQASRLENHGSDRSLSAGVEGLKASRKLGRDRRLPTDRERFPKMVELEALAGEIMERVPEIEGVCVNFNSNVGNRILGRSTMVLAGQPYLTEELKSTLAGRDELLVLGLQFQLSAESFFQVNSDTAVKLFELVLDAVFSPAKIERSRLLVIDAYAGVGSIALWLSPYCRQVIAVEENPLAVKDGRTNAVMNQIRNVEFRQGSVESVFPALCGEGLTPDVLILDPPRKGVSAGALKSAIELGAARIVYVSCNPSTLGRDLKFLEQNGYKTKQIQPIDMFPQTYHVESVTILDRVDGDARLAE